MVMRHKRRLTKPPINKGTKTMTLKLSNKTVCIDITKPTTTRIDTTLNTSFRDSGPWRSYHLETSGPDLKTCIERAIISEVDQNGGELSSYDLVDASPTVYADAVRVIDSELMRRFL
jgi:hypothetical protein